MLYLFNSAFRALYARNVLNTLCFPSGYTNEYRYKAKGETRQISPAMYEKLKTLRQGSETVICYIDRFGEGGYRYYPLRRAKYLAFREENDYMYLKVQLGEFIYPRDLNVFANQLRQALNQHELPKLTDNNPENTRDGMYAIVGDGIFGQASDYYVADDAWTHCVEDVSGTRRLSTNPQQSPVFVRMSLLRSDTSQPLVPSVKNNDAVFEFERSRPHKLVLTYRFPRQRTDAQAKAEAKITLGENLLPSEPTVLRIDSHANSVPVDFSSKRYPDDVSGAIQIVAENVANVPELLLPDCILRYQIRESAGFWAQAVLALLIFSLAGAFIGVDLSRLNPFNFHALWLAYWPKLIAAVLQTGALYWIFRLIGKKLV